MKTSSLLMDNFLLIDGELLRRILSLEIIRTYSLFCAMFSYHFNLCKACQIPPTYSTKISTCKNRTGISWVLFDYF